MMPKISIVIPVYNSARYLRECLDSILSQSFSDWEVVAVDDGSSDESPAILDDYAARDARFKVIHKVNGGVSAARNDGLDVASGEYVLFVDSDDWLSDNALQVLYEATSDCTVDVAIADHWLWKENGSESLHHFFAKEFSTDSADVIRDVLRMVLYKGYSPYPSPSCSYMFSALWSKLIRRKLLVENGIRFSSALKLYEDGLVALQVFQSAKSVSYRQEPVYHYRVLNNSLCHINEQKLVTDCANIVREVESFIQANGCEDALRDAFMARVLFLTKKMALRSFFCRGAQGTFFSRYKAFKGIFATEPYCSAVKNAARLKLCGNEKSYGKLTGHGLFMLTALLYELRARIRRR
ncbi:MAG: glycosyltransferase [Fibrobacter sp.]|nr:glycosyltransferase [Fibrobacter sp.]